MSEVTVIIPTFGRGLRVLTTIGHVLSSAPLPRGVIVHIDQSDGQLERAITSRFPDVLVLTSSTRLGPGGGRHQCLLRCQTEFAASFDDDSYPVDTDYFTQAGELLRQNPDAAIIGASIWQQGQDETRRNRSLTRRADFTGCGHVLRLEAYRQVRGYLARPIAYGMEETDLALQLFARGWKICDSGELRVFHDTELSHHQSADITAGSIANVALFGFLHYPAAGWPRALLQVGNKIVDALRRGRKAGIAKGLVIAPQICWNFKRYRAPLPWKTVQQFLRLRRTDPPA